jgi:hypothetical protein
MMDKVWNALDVAVTVAFDVIGWTALIVGMLGAAALLIAITVLSPMATATAIAGIAMVFGGVWALYSVAVAIEYVQRLLERGIR